MTSEDRFAHHPDDHRSTARGTSGNSAVQPHFSDASDHPGDYLSALLDHELDPALARSVGEHVDGCTACLSELTSLERVRRILRDLPPVTAPPAFVADVIDDRQRANRRGVAIAGLAAGLVLVAGLAMAEPQPAAEPAGRAAGRDDDLVRLESHQAPPREDVERSLADRAHGAASDLLDFLAG